jgi:DNA-binding Lrp family transcriptional regulator
MMAPQTMSELPPATAENIINIVREHCRPFITPGEIADRVSHTRRTVNNRLNELESDGVLKRRDVGSSAVVYYLPDESR